MPWKPLGAKGIFDRFRARAGSEQIASEFAVAGLADWLNRQRPRRVLEIGSGIGCLSEVIRRWMTSDFAAFAETEAVCVEDDPWCQAQWRQHLQFLPPGMRLVDKVPNEFFDFVVLDGPQLRPEDWAVLTPQATVFVEGRRRDQCQALRAFLTGMATVSASWRPGDRTKGYTVFRLAPTPAERRWFRYVRIREGLRDLLARLCGRPVGKRRS